MTPGAVITFKPFLENSGPVLDDKIPRWILKRAKWDKFKDSYIIKLKLDTNTTDEDNITRKTLRLLPKKNAEKTKLNFKLNNLEDYNQPFSLSELTDCIMKSHDTAVGPDEIHNEFLKQLPSCSLDFLLQAFKRFELVVSFQLVGNRPL